jgi:parallel beta-helix repeat protein
MSRDYVYSLVLVFVLIGLFGSAIRVQRVEASGTIFIRADGSIDPPTANITNVGNATYTFNSNLYDSIVVERDNIVIDGANYTIQGTGALGSIGVNLTKRIGVTIKNVEIEGFHEAGIYLKESSNGSIVRTSVVNNILFGIEVFQSNNITISETNVANNNEGIMFSSSPNGSIVESNIANASLGILVAYSPSCRVERSRIAGNGIGYSGGGIELFSSSDCTVARNTITDNFVAGIGVGGSSSNCSLVENNITANRDTGISIWSYGLNLRIIENNLANNRNGISMLTSSSNNITRNSFVNNGLFVYESSANVVEGNTVNGKPLVYLEGVSDYVVTDAGQVVLVNCNYIKIENFNLSNASVGVELEGTNNTMIQNNNIANNSEFGIYFLDSFSNIVCENNIENDDIGIYLHEASSNNIICHNSFVNNALYQAYSESDANRAIWDDGYPSGGNYWSDYTGADYKQGSDQESNGCDGIGDIEYSINANNTDHYPLMGMFSDFNTTSEYHVQTICNSTISNCQFNGTAITFDVSGENGTAGFCRICIPTSLMNGTYRVFVNGTEVSNNLLPCSNSTHGYLYFNYMHSTQEIVIVPELSSFLILPMFMMTALLAVIVYRRKHSKRHV